MSISPATLPRMTAAQYLEYEASQDTRHELVDGYLYAMTGASDEHERLAISLAANLHSGVKGGPFRTYKSDMKVAVGNDYFYPDIFVACGEVEANSYFRQDPVVIIEILSPSTQRHDRGDKRLAYESIALLEQYILISQDEKKVEVRNVKSADVTFLHSESDVLTLPSIDFSISLEEIYA